MNIKLEELNKKTGKLKSVTIERFRKALAKLSRHIQQHAAYTYRLWKQDNTHPGLHFKVVNNKPSVYSVRIGLSYRALGVKEEDTIIRFWIGSHEDYNKLLQQL